MLPAAQPQFCANCTRLTPRLSLRGKTWLCENCRDPFGEGEHQAHEKPDVSPVGCRLGVLRREIQRAEDARGMAKVLWIVAEGLHEGVFVDCSIVFSPPIIDVTLRLSGPPYAAKITKRLG